MTIDAPVLEESREVIPPYSLIEQITRTYSDAVFVYAAGHSGFLGQDLLEHPLEESSVLVKELEITPGAGTALLESTKSLRVSVLAHSSLVGYMLPVLSQLQSPLVAHVSLSRIDEQLQIIADHGDLSPLIAIKDIILVESASAADFPINSILVHSLAKSLKRFGIRSPAVIHAFDESSFTQLLLSRPGSEASDLVSSDSATSISRLVHDVLDKLNVGAFDLFGNLEAETVIITTAAALPVLQSRGVDISSYGILSTRIVRPFFEEAFISALKQYKLAKRIVLFECGSSLLLPVRSIARKHFCNLTVQGYETYFEESDPNQGSRTPGLFSILSPVELLKDEFPLFLSSFRLDSGSRILSQVLTGKKNDGTFRDLNATIVSCSKSLFFNLERFDVVIIDSKENADLFHLVSFSGTIILLQSKEEIFDKEQLEGLGKLGVATVFAKDWNDVLTILDKFIASVRSTKTRRSTEPTDGVGKSTMSLRKIAKPRETKASKIKTSSGYLLPWSLAFAPSFQSRTKLSPKEDKVYQIVCDKNYRVTPEDYERNVFHLEFDIGDSGLRYEIGDALGIYGENDPKLVSEFIDMYQLDGDSVVSYVNPEHPGVARLQTVWNLLHKSLDIFGRPNKRFYSSLASFAKDVEEETELLRLASPEGSAELKKRTENTVTYADLLKEFKSARPTITELLDLVPPVKPRHYSIASSQKVHPDFVHLLVVLVSWRDGFGRERFGQCTRYLRDMRPGARVTVSVKPSVMKLPPLSKQPIIMAGLGTGMAPFRAFIEERAWQLEQGMEIGPVVLYFGSRHRSQEYLYGEELEVYLAAKILSRLGLAFSRDQEQKIYIQHLIKDDGKMLSDLLLQQQGCFYLCGPTWPVPDVKNAIIHSFTSAGGMAEDAAEETLEALKESGRYILEVY
jgi:sulfite reductase alpha subunit-like flavoprotein